MGVHPMVADPDHFRTKMSHLSPESGKIATLGRISLACYFATIEVSTCVLEIMAMSHFIMPFFFLSVFESHSLLSINFSFLHFTFYKSTCSQVTFCKRNLVIRYREEETIVLRQQYNHL